MGLDQRERINMKIYEEVKEDNEIYLKLVDEHDRITLVVCNKYGSTRHKGYLLSINKSSGITTLLKSINSSLGLTLDEDGRLIIEKE